MTEFKLSLVTRGNSGHLADVSREFRSAGEPNFNSNPEEYLAKVERFAVGTDLPPDRVRSVEFWLFADGRAVGNSRLRPKLIPKLELDGGNISYDVFPSERGRGYGREILRLTLVEAAALDLPSVLLTTSPDNQYSIRVILGNGGQQVDRTISPFSGEELLRYEVRL